MQLSIVKPAGRKKKSIKKYIISLAVSLLVLLLIYTACLLVSGSFRDRNKNLFGPYDVVRVVDGDTFIALIDGEEVRIRLIGIDTPESVADKVYKENTAEGEKASEYTSNLLEGNMVFLEYDVERLDEYQRTLAYVYLYDGKTMVNELLLKNGYARTMAIEPNVKYQEKFDMLENMARAKKEGFWKCGFFK